MTGAGRIGEAGGRVIDKYQAGRRAVSLTAPLHASDTAGIDAWPHRCHAVATNISCRVNDAIS